MEKDCWYIYFMKGSDPSEIPNETMDEIASKISKENPPGCYGAVRLSGGIFGLENWGGGSSGANQKRRAAAKNPTADWVKGARFIIEAKKMTEERMICVKIRETKIRNGILLPHQKYKWEPIEPVPPKDWQERLHKVAELTQYISETGDGTEAGFNSIDVAISRLKDAEVFKLQIKELEDANRHLAKVNDKLMAEKKKNTAWLDQALNEGDGVYRP